MTKRIRYLKKTGALNFLQGIVMDYRASLLSQFSGNRRIKKSQTRVYTRYDLDASRHIDKMQGISFLFQKLRCDFTIRFPHLDDLGHDLYRGNHYSGDAFLIESQSSSIPLKSSRQTHTPSTHFLALTRLTNVDYSSSTFPPSKTRYA